MYANILIEYPVKTLDKTFTYIVPDRFLDIIKVGMKVTVPFNKSIVNGIVLELLDKVDFKEIKEIYNIENPDIYLNEELLELGKYIKKETLCTLITAYETMLPSALKINKSYSCKDKLIIIKRLVTLLLMMKIKQRSMLL